MGEYAKYSGRQIKIGTCENMYYLRADQAAHVQKDANSLDPNDRDVQQAIRFRFPFPDEDNVEPGDFDNPFRGLAVPGAEPPEGVEHTSIQFKADAGYLVSLPCPESGDMPEGLRVHRNGFSGSVKIVQQKWVGDLLALVCECACGAKWRMETLGEAQPIIDALRKESQKGLSHYDATAHFYRTVADRIEAGYRTEVPA